MTSSEANRDFTTIFEIVCHRGRKTDPESVFFEYQLGDIFVTEAGPYRSIFIGDKSVTEARVRTH